jgi:hypothetical protein
MRTFGQVGKNALAAGVGLDPLYHYSGVSHLRLN